MIYENEILKNIKKNSYFKEMYAAGMTPEEVKATIIKDLEGFFVNKKVVEEMAIDTLVSDWINLKNKSQDIADLDSKIQAVLSIYYDALATDKRQTLELIESFQVEHAKAGNLSWTLIGEQDYLNNSVTNLNDKLLKEMNFLGNAIEGILKVFLYEIYHLTRIRNRKTINFIDLFKSDYGVIADALNSWYPNTYEILNLKISDWRNIAYHHNYMISPPIIKCKYNKNNNEIDINEEQLEFIHIKLGEITTILNFAHKFFLFDNIQEVFSDNLEEGVYARNEIYNLPYICAISAQGYEIEEFKYDDVNTYVKLHELYSKANAFNRRTHIHNLLLFTWKTTNSKFVSIDYWIENQINMKVSVTSNNCKRLEKGEYGLETFYKKVRTKLYDL